MNPTCGREPTLSQSTGVAEALDRAVVSRAPVAGTLDLTYRCNFRCCHCYVGHLIDQPSATASELTTEQIKDLLSSAVDAGCLFLLLSGGEPLLREDFLEIYTFARRAGLLVTVFTNADLIRPEHIDVFREYPPLMVEVTVYGVTEDTYRRVTGSPGSLLRAQRGIERLVQAGIRVGLKTMILRENAHEIGEIEAFADKLGLGFRLDPLLIPRLDGGREPLLHSLNLQQAVEIELHNPVRRDHLAQYHKKMVEKGSPRGLSNDRQYLCGAGLSSFHVDPQGLLRPCLLSRVFSYSVNELGFSGAWDAAKTAVDNATWEDGGRCAGCSVMHLCGYCPGIFLLEETTPACPPEYLCRLGECRLSSIIHKGPGVDYDMEE